MITVRKSHQRGQTNFGWLQSRHTFSFGEYQDPEHVDYGPLRVINDDWIAGGGGFPTHPHRDMEIFSYVVEGSLQHRDSLGHTSVIHADGVQRLTAGHGITHSEFNPSPDQPMRLLQIWIKPRARGLVPSYEEKQFVRADKINRLLPLLSPDQREGSVRIEQDAVVYASVLQSGQSVEHDLVDERTVWVQVVRGRMELNGITLEAGDGAAVEAENRLLFLAREESDFLLLDLPPK